LRYIIAIIAAVLIVFILYLTTANYTFKNKINREALILSNDAKSTKNKNFGAPQIEGLPEPVKNYLLYVLPVGTPHIKFVKLKHTGTFRTNPGEEWREIEGMEFFNAREPGFLWHGKVNLNKYMWIGARDKYINGEGAMTVKLLSAISIVNETGQELAIAGLQRYLSEIPWFPTAFLQDKYIQWEAISDSSARAIITDGLKIASGIFYFNDNNEITKFETIRYRMTDDGFKETKWTGRYLEYRNFQEHWIPTSVEVEWNMLSGDFEYARFQLTDMEYDNFIIEE